MKAVLWFLALLALLNAAQASVVISQVLYDPTGTESGGEAVEIRNDGSSAINISKWFIATESSTADATIPEGTLLQPGAVFLIADTGWNSSRDNPAWKNADLEETITLANSDSGIALKNSSGIIMDAVGWGNPANIKQGLYEGTPALPAPAGKALARTRDTGNNAGDVTEAEAMFFSGNYVVISVNVTASNKTAFLLGAVLDEDDSAEPGVQLRPVAGSTRALHLKAYYNGSRINASWFGLTISLAGEGGVWNGELPLKYWNAPGEQQIILATDTGNTTITATILEVSAAKIDTKTVSLKSSPGRTAEGIIRVRNEGNVPVEVSWAGNDFVFGNNTIPFESLVIVSKQIMPREMEDIDIHLDVPDGTTPGEYRTIVRMNED